MKRLADAPAVHEPDASMPARNNWQASLSLGFADDAGTTRLIERSHFGPLRVQKPLYPEGPEVCHTIVVHPPGGVVGGDRLSIAAGVQARAKAFVTTPGAAKWYRANGETSRQDVQIDVAAGGAMEWLPQETIFFNDAAVDLRQDITLAADAHYIGWEILCFGRTASGEVFDRGSVRQKTSIRRGGKLVWFEQGKIGGDSTAMGSPLSLAGRTVCATLIAVGNTVPAAALQALREHVAGISQGRGDTGASLLKQVCVVRYLGDSSEVARAVMAGAWQHLRPLLMDRAAVTPRIWNT